MTTYTHYWLEREFGGEVKLHGKRILSIAHLPGMRDILRMPTREDMVGGAPVRLSMSAMRMDCMQAGIDIGPFTIEQKYHLTPKILGTFVPIECPRMAMTANGVLRPWNRMTTFGKTQAFTLCRMLRSVFWKAVENYDSEMRAEARKNYADVRMIEGFCADTGTPDIYIDDLRREWQRQCTTRRTKKIARKI